MTNYEREKQNVPRKMRINVESSFNKNMESVNNTDGSNTIQYN